MLVDLPSPVLQRASLLTSWMLYPGDEKLRSSFRAALNRGRYAATLELVATPSAPLPYVWQQSGDGELALVLNPRTNKPESPVRLETGEDMFDVTNRMFMGQRESGEADVRAFHEAYKAGFAAGCVLLCCYIFANNPEDRYSASMKKGIAATKSLLGISDSSVKKFYAKFSSVAHLWAAYHVSAWNTFEALPAQGIERHAKSVSFGFLDPPTVEAVLDDAMRFRTFGIQRVKTEDSGTLLSDATALNFTRAVNHDEMLLIPQRLVDLSLGLRPAGKLSARSKLKT